jgi:hypothetical protein
MEMLSRSDVETSSSYTGEGERSNFMFRSYRTDPETVPKLLPQPKKFEKCIFFSVSDNFFKIPSNFNLSNISDFERKK